MAIDKAVDSSQLNADLKAIADAIRTKGGTSGLLEFPSGFVDAVGAIQAGSGGGGENQIDDIIAGNLIDVVSDAENCAEYAFYYNRYIKSVSMPNLATVPSNMLAQSTSIQSVYFPKAIKIGERAFWNTPLEIADIPEVQDIGMQAFQGAKIAQISNMENINIISDGAFKVCKSLVGRFSFPSIVKVGYSAFQNCTGITAIEFGSSQKDDNTAAVRNTVFSECTALQTVIFRATTLLSMQNVSAFANTPIASGTGYIYVPSVLVDSYKAATNWTTYANQIRAIEDYPEITGG